MFGSVEQTDGSALWGNTGARAASCGKSRQGPIIRQNNKTHEGKGNDRGTVKGGCAGKEAGGGA